MANELMSMPLDEAIPLTRACGESYYHILKLLTYIPERQAVRQKGGPIAVLRLDLGMQGTTSTSHRSQKPIIGTST